MREDETAFTGSDPIPEGPGEPPPVPEADALHAAHAGRVRWIVEQILRKPEDVEDCIQEVWLAVHASRHQVEDRERLGAWISAVTRNKALEWLRGAARRRRALGAALEVARYEDSLRGTPEGLDRRTPLLEAISALEPEERRLVELRLEDDGRTLEDLAGLVGSPRHRVKYLWQKVKETLRARLVEWGAAESYLA